MPISENRKYIVGAANPSLVSENSTGKRTATVYVQEGVGSWIPVSELTFAPNESKRLMVGVPNLLVMAQADNGILDSPSYPTATIPEKSIIFSLTYAGAEYNGEWTIGYNGKIGY